MKRNLLIVFMTVFINGIITNSALAQRHLTGTNSVGVTGGITKLGTYFGATYSRFLSSKVYVTGELGYEKGSLEDAADYSHYFFNPGAYYKLFKIGSNIYFNAGGGLSVSMHDVTYTQEIANDNTHTNFGFFVGIDPEIYFTDKIVLVVSAKQGWFINSEPGSEMWWAGLGLKYNF